MLKMRGRMSLLRHSRRTAQIRYTTLKRSQRNLFMMTVVVATIIIYVTSRLLARRPLHVLVKFSDEKNEIHQGFSLIIQDEDFQGHVTKKIKEEDNVMPKIMTSLRRLVPGPDEVIPRKAKWKLNPINKCKNSSPYLLLLIASHESMTTLRDVIRNTWCKQRSFTGGRNILCIFLVGQNEGSKETASDVTQEYILNRDIIKQSFTDTFRNSSRKMMMGMEWMKEYCPDAKYVMKTEDDVIVNTDVIMNKILPKAKTGNYFIGKCWSDAPNRNPKSRFFISEEEYPAGRYPTYCGRTGLLMSGDVTKKMYEASFKIPHLPLDDIFAGVLLEQMKITPVDTPGFLARFDEESVCANTTSAATVHAHGMDVQHVWDTIQEKCKL